MQRQYNSLLSFTTDLFGEIDKTAITMPKMISHDALS